jgi:hypothetical protein
MNTRLLTQILSTQVLSLLLVSGTCPLIAAGPSTSNTSKDLAVAETSTPSIPKDHVRIECTIKPVDRSSHHRTHPHIPFGVTRGPLGYSTNWSGYVAETSLSKPTVDSVSAVSGSWIVPTIKPSTDNTYCAIWVGIDGYSNSTVEQIGTEHDCIDGTVKHSAWFEMYPGGSYDIPDFPLSPGDVISASVKYTSKNVFTMIMSNNTKKITTIIPTQYTKSSTAKRQSAEWVIEAPYLNAILPLADFGTAYLSNCKATIKGISGFVNNKAWVASGIEMVTNSSMPKDIPTTLGSNGTFAATWKHQ